MRILWVTGGFFPFVLKTRFALLNGARHCPQQLFLQIPRLLLSSKLLPINFSLVNGSLVFLVPHVYIQILVIHILISLRTLLSYAIVTASRPQIRKAFWHILQSHVSWLHVEALFQNRGTFLNSALTSLLSYRHIWEWQCLSVPLSRCNGWNSSFICFYVALYILTDSVSMRVRFYQTQA